MPPATSDLAPAAAPPEPAGSPVLEVDGLEVTFPRSRRPALSGVHLTVGAGEQLLVLGPSGSGKSTLLRAVAGIVPHACRAVVEGDVRYHGRDARDLDVVERSAWTGYLAQDPATSVCLARVDDEIAFPLENRAVAPVEICHRVGRALEEHRLGDLADRALSTLSGGQLQRVALAAALVTEPDLLLLDEPTAMLDPAAAHEVGQAIARLADGVRRPAVLLVEHRLDELAEAGALPAHAVVLGSDGRVRAQGATSEVLRGQARELVRDGSWLPLAVELELATGSSWPRGDLLAPLAGGHAGAQERAEAPADEALLSARGVTVRRGGRAVVDGVDLDFHRGRLTAVVGRNGAGKTSLLLALAGLLPREEVCGAVSGARAGMVFQRPEHQFVARTVAEEVRHGADPATAERLVDVMGLRDLEQRDPHRLSGGEQRRLSLAAIAAQGHQVILADEPTFGLDRRHARVTASLLRELADEGRSVVVTTHDLRLAALVADRLVVVDDGAVLIEGGVEAVLRSGRLAEVGIRMPALLRWWVRESDLPVRALLAGLDHAVEENAASAPDGRQEEVRQPADPPDGWADAPAAPAREPPVPPREREPEGSASPPSVPQRRSWLAGRNPAVKLCLLLAVTCGLFLVFDPLTPAILYAAVTLAAPAAARVSPRRVLQAQLPLFSFALSLVAVNAVTRGGEVLARLGPLEVTDEGLMIGAALALRMAAVAAAAVLFVLSTDGVALLRSLEQQLRVPPRIAYAVLAAHRLLETLPEEWAQARAAQQMRGTGSSGGRAARLGRAAFAILVGALRRGERLATTLEARGLGDGPRTHWRPVRLGAGDALLVLVTLALVGAALAVSSAAGSLLGPGVTGIF